MSFTPYILLLLVIAGAALAARTPFPQAVVWSAIGLIVAFLPKFPSVLFDPQLALFFFLPPLVYSAAVDLPWPEFRDNIRPISMLAIGLVLVTAAGAAAIAHYVAGLPWAVAIVAGATISPTDPAAASAVAARVGIPRRLIAILEGEGLVNDAVALVIFRISVLAAVSGSFSFGDAAIRFFAILIGEPLYGWLLASPSRKCESTSVRMVSVINSKRIVPRITPIGALARPFQAFAARETSGGVVLLACTVAALAWANSPWARYYQGLLHTPVAVRLGGLGLSRELHFWVNDALMAVFFFVVGLEIKRELLAGELASRRQAALPILAALGGVVVPALLYTTLNAAGPGSRGWGIPMATDIAFAIGVMALLGDRIPLGLKVFLTALAIVDDIAAVLVIAVFYTSDLAWGALGIAAFCLILALAANRLGVRHPLPYALIGVVLWMAVLQSGVHATIAGVLLALVIPCRTAIDQEDFLHHGRAMLDHFETAARTEPLDILSDIEQQTAVEALEDACEKMQPPLHRLEHGLHPWVTFLIMPLFALANAGVSLSGDLRKAIMQPVTLGVVFGLLLGKTIGVTLAAWLAVQLGVASLPERVSWKQIHGAGWLAGIGFTMSLFMTGLAFEDEAQLKAAKIGILIASLCAGATGSTILARR